VRNASQIYVHQLTC